LYWPSKARKGVSIVYSPRIDAPLVRKLYLLKQREKKSMVKLANLAIADFINKWQQRHGILEPLFFGLEESDEN
jgi:cobalamin-dependent methionine synthase I